MLEVKPVGAHIASRYDGEIIEAYFPRSDGDCDLLWMFDGAGLSEHEPRRYLKVRLTETEARSIFERERTKTGILEPVRRSMTHADATILQNIFEGGDHQGVADFTIPAEGDELAFLGALDEAPVLTIGELEQRSRNRIAKLNDMEREMDAAIAEHGPLTRLWVITTTLGVRWRIRRLRHEVERDIRAERTMEDALSKRAISFEHALI